MVFFIKIVTIFLLSPILMAQAQTEQDSLVVPPLPTEDATDQAQASNSDINLLDNSNVVTLVPTHDKNINPGFFTNTSRNTGLPRSFNAIDISGYLRLNMPYFRNAHLGTYVPGKNKFTSNFMPNLSIYEYDGVEDDNLSPNPAQNNFSMNMRLRLDPTINITPAIRIRTTVDVFDNMVLGTTSTNLDPKSAINLKRAWGEATFPIGELRFGRMPFHWGLGILYNSGDDLKSITGDQVDGLLFNTRVFDHYLMPGYVVSYDGKFGRSLEAQNSLTTYYSNMPGQRYPQETGGIAHTLMLSLLKRDSDFITNKKRAEGRSIFNYGIFTAYRHQALDAQHITDDNLNLANYQKLVKRDANLGFASLWGAFSYGTFNIEAETVGVWGKYKYQDLTDSTIKRDVWLLQAGAALESRYGFLKDRLQVGLNTGWASSQTGDGFGFKLPANNGYMTAYKFNSAYQVDLLLHREILGTVASSVYIKPHLSYFFSQNFGLRTDVITTLAPHKSNTSGKSNWLGVEIDASAFLRTDSGFFFQLAYGVLVPLAGLDHHKTLSGLSTKEYDIYGQAKVAQTLQLFFGLTF